MRTTGFRRQQCGVSIMGLLTALVIVIVLTILAEVVSFSKVIDRVPPLRALDRAGTTPERKAA